MSADELFEELGYYHEKRSKEDERFHIEYISDESIIQFWYDKTISKMDKDVDDASYITMQELKAINKKVEEMGWNE